MKKYRILFSLILVMGLLVGTFGFVSADETDPTDEESVNQNPVAGYLATLTGLPVDQILILQSEGYGMGEIAKAYYLLTMDLEPVVEGTETEEGSESEVPTVTLADLQELLIDAKAVGWGNYFKELGLNPGIHGGIGWLYQQGKQMQLEAGETFRNGKPDKEVGPPEHANNDKDKVKGPKK
jgi:hypothetical protein